jgi:hypothetical protein
VNASGLFVYAVITQRSGVMKRKDRFASKDSFFYALVILATLVVTRYGFLVELVEQTGVFRS